MRTTNPQGFTLLEVLVSIILLTTGIGALVGTAAITIRMVHGGRQSMRALEAAVSQLETLRARSATGSASCQALAGGADSSGDGVVRSWSIRSAGALQEVSILVSVPRAGGRDSDTLSASLWCPQ